MAGSGVSTEDAYNAADVIPEQLVWSVACLHPSTFTKNRNIKEKKGIHPLSSVH